MQFGAKVFSTDPCDNDVLSSQSEASIDLGSEGADDRLQKNTGGKSIPSQK